MQRYGKFLKWMFNLSFLLLKMRELTQNEHKITNFIHFNVQNGKFYRKKLIDIKKITIFAQPIIIKVWTTVYY